MRQLRAALHWWIDAVTARPWLVALVATLLAAVSLWYTLAYLRIDTDTTDMISAEVPFRQHDRAFVRAFPEFSNPIVAVIEGAVPERVQLAAEALADALRADHDHFTAVDYPAGLPFFATQGLLFLEVEDLAALTERLAEAQPLLAALAEDPNLRGLAAFTALVVGQQNGGGELPAELDRLFGEMAAVVEAQLEDEPAELSWRGLLEDGADGAIHRQLVVAQPRLDYASLAPASEAIAALRAAAARLNIGPQRGLELYLTGGAVLEDEELASVATGAITASVATTVAVALLLLWGLRSWRLIVATLWTLAVGLLVTAGFTTLAIGRLNLISVAFAVLFVGLGVDFGIHVVLRYQEQIRRAANRIRAIEIAAQNVAGALTLSALCAALGFLSFVPTAYLGLAELGMISAFGMLVAWLASLALLPALLCLMPLKQAPPIAQRGLLLPIERHSRPILTLAGIAGFGSLLALPYLNFDFNPLNLKDPNAESVITFHRLKSDPETSPYVIDILAPSLEEADQIAGDLATLRPVGETMTIKSFVPEAQDEKLALVESLAWLIGPLLEPAKAAPLDADERDQALDRLRTTLADGLSDGLAAEQNPGTAALARALGQLPAVSGERAAAQAELEARLMGLLPVLLEDLRQALEAEEVSLHELPAAIRDQWLTPDGQARVLVRPAWQIDNNAELQAFAEAVLAEVPYATGTPIVVLEGGNAVVRAFVQASVLAMVLIVALLAVILRDLRDTLLVLAPIVLAALLTAASAVLLGLSINFANVIVLPLLLGLGVSGSIHVVMRQRQHGGVVGTSTPRAVVFSGLTTIASFGALALSDHLGLASMGLLLTIAILWSLVCTLVVLPGMLVVTSRQRARAPAAGPP
jgi:hopanoid biosynthesis associated RND transporter like protein HpnN